jgi:hypothetical protein
VRATSAAPDGSVGYGVASPRNLRLLGRGGQTAVTLDANIILTPPRIFRQ